MYKQIKATVVFQTLLKLLTYLMLCNQKNINVANADNLLNEQTNSLKNKLYSTLYLNETFS